MSGISTTGGFQVAYPSLQIERWAIDMMNLVIVPPLMWQASLFIHKRKLAVYS